MSDHPPPRPNISNQIAMFAATVEGLRQAVDEERAIRAKETAAHEREIVAHERETDVLRLKFYTARRAIRLVVIFGIVGFLINFGLVVRQQQQADQRQRDRAEQACNIVKALDVYTVTLGKVSPAATPEDAANKQRLIDKLRNDFRAAIPAPLGCDPKTITTSTTFPTTQPAG